MAERFRLVTYNIRKGKGASGREPQDVLRLAQALSSERPQLLLCQEVFHGLEVSQTDALSQHLAMTSYYEPNKHRRIGHHGNATFTTMTVAHAQNFDVSTNRIERRGVLYTCLVHGGRKLHVFNAHLGLNGWQRMTQAKRIGEILGEHCLNGDPVLLAGDFNDWNGKLDRFICEELGLENAFAHLPPRLVNTWHARRPVFNLDRVYVRNAEVASAVRLSGDPWQELSDHLPLLVELELSP